MTATSWQNQALLSTVLKQMQGPHADIAEEFPDIVDLFRHYDGLYFEVCGAGLLLRYAW
jgi:hypothetical protein